MGKGLHSFQNASRTTGTHAGWDTQETQPQLSLPHLKGRTLASQLSTVIVETTSAALTY